MLMQFRGRFFMNSQERMWSNAKWPFVLWVIISTILFIQEAVSFFKIMPFAGQWNALLLLLSALVVTLFGLSSLKMMNLSSRAEIWTILVSSFFVLKVAFWRLMQTGAIAMFGLGLKDEILHKVLAFYFIIVPVALLSTFVVNLIVCFLMCALVSRLAAYFQDG
jgi:hypothetical protein